MVATLIRLKLAVLRNSRTDERAATSSAGLVLGLTGVGALWWLVLAPGPNPTADRQLLTLGLTLAMVGWAVAPVLAGEPVLQARHFRLLGLPRTTLTLGLLVATLIGVPGGLTVLGFGSLLPMAGAAVLPVAVAALTGAASVLLVVLVGRVLGTALSRLSATRLGAASTGALTGHCSR